MLDIKNLKASVEGKKILNGFNLKIKSGEVHAIMGPNGSGKSTLANVLTGKNGYEIEGKILYQGERSIDRTYRGESSARFIYGFSISFRNSWC